MTAMSLAIPQLVASNILTMTGQHKFMAGAASIGTLLNIALSLALIRPFGLVGVAMGTLLATLVIDFAVILPRACRRHGVKWGSYLRRVMPAALVPGVIQWALTWILKERLSPGDLFEVVLIAIPGVAAYGITFWFFSLDRSEKRLLQENLILLVAKTRNSWYNRAFNGKFVPAKLLFLEDRSDEFAFQGRKRVNDGWLARAARTDVSIGRKF